VILALRALHVLGVILWVGGMTTATVVVALGADDTRRAVAGAARRAVLFVATPGLVLAWVAGLSMLVPHWSDAYATAPWMHGKLTIAVVITALSGVLTGRLRKGASGKVTLAPGALWGIGLAIPLMAAAVLILVMLKPGE